MVQYLYLEDCTACKTRVKVLGIGVFNSNAVYGDLRRAGGSASCMQYFFSHVVRQGSRVEANLEDPERAASGAVRDFAWGIDIPICALILRVSTTFVNQLFLFRAL